MALYDPDDSGGGGTEGPVVLRLDNLLIIRMGFQEVAMTLPKVRASLDHLHLYGVFPSLWGLLRLWWRHRGLRRAQLKANSSRVGIQFVDLP